MTVTLTIELTDAEAYALDLIAVNKQEWVSTAMKNWANTSVESLKITSEWPDAIAAVGAENGDTTNLWTVLMKAKELNLFKTAAQKNEEKIPFIPPEAPIVNDSGDFYILPKQLPFLRATEEEAEILEQVLNGAPARLRMIYNGATHINSSDELFATLELMVSTALGEERASELLAPQE